MKVLFIKEVENVAQPGEIKDVASGFARNFLLPKQIAVPATAGTIKQHAATIEQEKKRVEKSMAEQRELATKLQGVNIILKARAGNDGRLYGSVTAPEIVAALEAQAGYAIDRKVVHLTEPIRRVGVYEVPIRMRKDLIPKISVTVEPENLGS